MVQIHHTRNAADGDHVRAVDSHKDKKEEEIRKFLFGCKEEVRCEKSYGKNDSDQSKPPSCGIRLKVEVLITLSIGCVPTVIDRPCPDRPVECRTSIFIGLTEVQLWNTIVVMTHKGEIVTKHEREVQRVSCLSCTENIEICRGSCVRFQFWIHGRCNRKMQVPDTAKHDERADSPGNRKLNDFLPLRKERIRDRQGKENNNEPNEFCRECCRKCSAVESRPEDESRAMMLVFQNEQERECGERSKKHERSFQHGSSAVHNEGVIEDVRERKEEGIPFFFKKHQENQEQDGRCPPGKKCREEAIAHEGKSLWKISPVTCIYKLIILRITVKHLLSCRDQQFSKRRMRFHEEHPIQILLCACNVIVFVPEQCRRIPVAHEVRAKREKNRGS